MLFLNHTQRCTTVGRTPLDEGSARRRDLYLTTQNTHNRQTSMRPVGFELHNLSRRAATETGKQGMYIHKYENRTSKLLKATSDMWFNKTWLSSNAGSYVGLGYTNCSTANVPIWWAVFVEPWWRFIKWYLSMVLVLRQRSLVCSTGKFNYTLKQTAVNFWE